MSHNNPETVGQNVEFSAWWTPSRTKLAGLAGVIGGLGLAGLSISRTELSIDQGAISQVSPIGYAFLVVAGYARYSGGSIYVNGGRVVAIVLALSLVSYAGSIIILGMTRGWDSLSSLIPLSVGRSLVCGCSVPYTGSSFGERRIRAESCLVCSL